jgi:ribosome-interacting GTPase 1
VVVKVVVVNMGILEKIADIEKEIARTQKNKGTFTNDNH